VPVTPAYDRQSFFLSSPSPFRITPYHNPPPLYVTLFILFLFLNLAIFRLMVLCLVRALLLRKVLYRSIAAQELCVSVSGMEGVGAEVFLSEDSDY
jgi:hypothetical protein